MLRKSGFPAGPQGSGHGSSASRVFGSWGETRLIFRGAGEWQHSGFLCLEIRAPRPSTTGTGMHWWSWSTGRGDMKMPHGPPGHAVTAGTGCSSPGEMLVYLAKARSSVRARGQATAMVTMSRYLKQRTLMQLLQLLACLAVPCPCHPRGIFLCLPLCSQSAQCRGCEGNASSTIHHST